MSSRTYAVSIWIERNNPDGTIDPIVASIAVLERFDSEWEADQLVKALFDCTNKSKWKRARLTPPPSDP